jgi:hypothetical protein
MKKPTKKEYDRMYKIITNSEKEPSFSEREFIRIFYKAFVAQEKIDKGRKIMEKVNTTLIDEDLRLKYNKDFDNPSIKVMVKLMDGLSMVKGTEGQVAEMICQCMEHNETVKNSIFSAIQVYLERNNKEYDNLILNGIS